MNFDITIWGAFVAGLASFVSPCILPLVPPYLGYLAGISYDEVQQSTTDRLISRRIVLAAFAFVLGFSTVFMLMGASASMLGQLFEQYRTVLTYIAGVVICILGLHFLGVFRIAMLYRDARIEVSRKPAGFIGAYIIGLAFAFGWSPCVGPILATILFIASNQDSVMQGVWLLAGFSFGIGVPFMIAALFAQPFMRFMQRFRKAMGYVEKAIGVMLLATGILILTNQFGKIGVWMQSLAL